MPPSASLLLLAVADDVALDSADCALPDVVVSSSESLLGSLVWLVALLELVALPLEAPAPLLLSALPLPEIDPVLLPPFPPVAELLALPVFPEVASASLEPLPPW